MAEYRIYYQEGFAGPYTMSRSLCPYPMYTGPDKPKGSAPVAGDLYKIAITTSDKMAAATDATVRLAFVDAGGRTWQPVFPQTKGMFKRNSTHECEASSLFSLGDLTSCKVWMDQATTSMGDDWHLDRITVSHVPSNRTWVFNYKNWLPKQGVVLQAQVWAGVQTIVLLEGHDYPSRG